jgi:hypothetical protein
VEGVPIWHACDPGREVAGERIVAAISAARNAAATAHPALRLATPPAGAMIMFDG